MSEVLADRYELETLLGTGGMARVYEAYDRLLDRRVAVKLLRDDLGVGSGRQSVLSEARAAASFSHPHAVAVYDIGRHEARPFIVMELVEGCSLGELLARGGELTPEQAVAVAGQVLAALEAAHHRGLVHRDVKPANMLLPGCRVPSEMDADRGVKLADFGIAKGIREAAGELTLAGKVIGTPTYLSPEQVGGDSASPRSDLYSVGVVLYEMLAGRPPFQSDSPVAVALAHQQREPDRLDRLRPDLPTGLVALVHRALEKDPELRYASAEEMRSALRHWREDAAGVGATLVDARPVAADDEREYQYPAMTSASSRPSRMTGARPAVTVGVIALVLLALITLGGLLREAGDRAAADETGTDAATEAPAEEAATEPPAAVEEPTDEPTPAEPDEEPTDGGGFSLPGVSLPDPSEIGPGRLGDVVSGLPGALVGERRDDLASGLEDVASTDEDERPSAADELRDQVSRWVAEGELNQQIGGLAEQVLQRLATG